MAAFAIMKKTDPAIVMTDDGFYFEGSSAQVRWSAIRRISTYKIDLLTTDEIRLAFEHDDSELIFEVSEEQPGFGEFKRYVERRFAFFSRLVGGGDETCIRHQRRRHLFQSRTIRSTRSPRRRGSGLTVR